MIGNRKSAVALTAADVRTFPVWEYVNDEVPGEDETWVVPVTSVPVDDLSNRIAGVQVTLANGGGMLALLANIDLNSIRRTEHFLQMRIEWRGEWFSLARYHDEDIEQCGPDALARFLGLPIEQVFPIAYDIRHAASGEDDVLVGFLRATPVERLSQTQLMDLVFA